MYRKQVRNSTKMKLTDTARQMLVSNPERFLQTYGPWYTSEIYYGGAFLGFHNLCQRIEDQEKHLDKFKQFDPNTTFFTQHGSDEFKDEVYRTDQNLVQVENLWSWGGPQVSLSNLDPFDMGTQYTNWIKQLSQNKSQAANIKVEWRNWIEVEEVK